MEVGETFIRGELFDLAFNLNGKYEFAFSNDQVTEQNIVEEIIRCVKTLTTVANVKESEVLGIGIGFPGLVDPVKGLSIFTPNWGGWHNVSITKQLAGHLAAPIYIDNGGAKLMAVGELLFGAGRGLSHFVVLLMGTGIGSGIIANGKLFRGSSNNAGGNLATRQSIQQDRCADVATMVVWRFILVPLELFLAISNLVRAFYHITGMIKSRASNKSSYCLRMVIMWQNKLSKKLLSI